MECEELIEIIKSTEEKFVHMGIVEAPVVSVAAAVYSQLLPEPDIAIYRQLEKFFELTRMIDELRHRIDPRCAGCKTLRPHGNEVLQ